MANEGSTKPTYEELTNEQLLGGMVDAHHLTDEDDDKYQRMREEALRRMSDGARVRGLLQRQWMPTESAPKTGEHILVKDEGCTFGLCGGKMQPWYAIVHYWGHPGEEGFYLTHGDRGDSVYFTHWRPIEPPTFPQSSSLVPEGAESADIGKPDSADKKCAYCKHTHTFQFDEIVDDDCPVVGCPCMHFLGSAETGGEKAALEALNDAEAALNHMSGQLNEMSLTDDGSRLAARLRKLAENIPSDFTKNDDLKDGYCAGVFDAIAELDKEKS